MRVILYIVVPFDITVGHFLKKMSSEHGSVKYISSIQILISSHSSLHHDDVSNRF
jgi:hypothetical protein